MSECKGDNETEKVDKWYYISLQKPERQYLFIWLRLRGRIIHRKGKTKQNGIGNQFYPNS